MSKLSSYSSSKRDKLFNVDRFRSKVYSYDAMFSTLFIILAAILSYLLIHVVAVESQVCSRFVDPCPASWHHWRNSCYRVTDSSFYWSRARDECIKLGGILAVPRSLEENEFFVTLIPDSANPWIDCNDLDSNGIWECRQGNIQVTYRNWDVSDRNYIQPNGGSQKCVFLWGSLRQWHDYYCDSYQQAVCKKGIDRPLLHM